VDAQAHDPRGEPADRANERKGLRALFRDATPGTGDAQEAEPDANPPTSQRRATPRAKPRALTPAARMRRDGPRLTATRDARGSIIKSPDDSGSDAGVAAAAPTSNRPARRQQFAGPLTARPIISPRLRADPRLGVWVSRSIVAIAVFAGFALWIGWRYGLTAAAVYAAADVLFRSKTAVVVPASVRITSAQRFTRRRLRINRLLGYHSLNARTIPGTEHVIDHVVIGPAGVFSLDSQRLDRRLPLRMRDGMLYHGRTSMARRLDHARDEAAYAASLLEAELGHPVAVRPVMVTYGPSTSWMIMRVKGVDVFDGRRVGKYFRRQSGEVGRGSKTGIRDRLSASQIEAIIAAADRALPPLA